MPVSFAHGFVTLQADSKIVYKCTEYYSPVSEGVVRWDSCGINWPLNNNLILSNNEATQRYHTSGWIGHTTLSTNNGTF